MNPMRRKDRGVFAPEEITAIMEKCEVVCLAFFAEKAPYILPVNFGMEPDGMTLYIHGAMEGYKYTLMEQNPCVGFEMEVGHGIRFSEEKHTCTFLYESVIGWGELEEITDPEEKKRALDILMAHYHGEHFAYGTAPIPYTRVLKLNVRERTGKRRS